MNHSEKTLFEEKIKLEEKIKEYRQQMIDTLCEIVAIPTANPPGQSYRECVDYLSARLKEYPCLA